MSMNLIIIIVVSSIVITIAVAEFVAQREVYGRYKGLLIHLLIKDHIEDRKAKKAREQRRYERLKRRLES